MAKRSGDCGQERGSFCKYKTEVAIKEEVVSASESCQQLEPEFLTCAAQLSLYKGTETLLAIGEDDLVIDEGDLPDTEEMSDSITRDKLASGDHQIRSATMDQVAKRTSGEWSAADDGNIDTDSLSEKSKRCKLLEHQTSDGQHKATKHLKASASPVAQKINSPHSLNKCRDFSEDNVGKSELHHVSSHQTVEDSENGSASENSSVHVAADLTTPIITPRATKREKKGVNSSTAEERGSLLDKEEDLYRDEEEIKKEKITKVPDHAEKDAGDHKLGVGPEMDMVEYCRKEWRGKTAVAKLMKEGYEEVSHSFGSIRQVRGDNYCALRATLFQALSHTKLPTWLQNEDLTQLSEKLVEKYDWINLWRFWQAQGSKKVWVRFKEYLELLKKRWAELSEMTIPEEKQAVCDEIFRNEEEEYCLYEAVKFLMLKTAIDLYNANDEGKEVPVFSWLLFARNTSSSPCEFLKNHLNQVGHTGGLEQVEMFLLGHALQHTIKVYRLYKYATDEFVTHYPNDEVDWPMVTLITEDDRHYNVPVRMCEETSV
ncbi:ubiquitin thioesterase otulin isoform X2 [Ascaphus truei]|uniref:ubiquitin thioesterase otulin isoform X2 n=1 Tax=Ascaphus truei TaxID=8439 RepID=UPI003F5AAAF6